jgi:two-component system, cell cycle sensor histidine kinase and response regulator CckA
MREAIAAASQAANAGNGACEGPMRQTILLVEDEEMVRGLMYEVLEQAGYEVLACGTPAEAIEVSRRHDGPIDLLLTDVVMPGMNGREMAERIHEILPRLQVVFMSGYTEHALTYEGKVDPKFEYLQKPFTLKTLTQKLAKVLQKLDQQAG